MIAAQNLKPTSFHGKTDHGPETGEYGDATKQSAPSSPISSQSFLSLYSGAAAASPLSVLDGITSCARSSQHAQATLSNDLADVGNMEHWLATGQILHGSAACLTSPSHRRDSSLSSLGSAGSSSPYAHRNSNPQIAVTDSAATESLHGMPILVRPVELRRQENGEQAATPDDCRRSFWKNENSCMSFGPAAFPPVPKLDRTMTDVYGDELYSPDFSLGSVPLGAAPISPSSDVFAQRLQAANSQHLSAAQSPASASSRGRSPFRQGSPLAPSANPDFPSTASAGSMRCGSEQSMRNRQRVEQAAQARQRQIVGRSDSGTPQTISPKDAVLEFRESDSDADFSLFPTLEIADAETSHPVKGILGEDSFGGLSLDGTHFDYATPSSQGSQMPQMLPQRAIPQVPQQYPFIPQAQSPSQPLTDSAVAATASPVSIGRSPPALSEAAAMGRSSSSPQRPVDTSADGGTYTCTYHGCSLRFETPALLQKHKKQGHRQANNGLDGAGRSDTPTAAGIRSNLAMANTQAGPHRCDRVNPSTGKPCNTVFSRPYDLTRHEDTIHNARKQKVRCQLCTDEKTFSRADALTRHFRVCHPEVEFPGRHRRRAFPAS